jgi:hypothetical protein
MTALTRTQKFLLLALIGVLLLVGVSALLAHLHTAQNWSGHVMMFDEDLSDSLVGWMIAIPVLMLTAVLVTIVLAGTGILLLGVLAMVVVLVLCAVVFGLAMAVLPFVAFFAVPILFVWLIVKFARRKEERLAQGA